ncbi:uncharacterized protein LOC126272270 [Schistocerca gregaria]|uniref:uncharacterized protein LOC126272270 n=1 Tax=Schistocerca gregaria TaxID=7010 RepID=UPI00211ED36C|nr:uncharacterized protein LOC126272270 [Schistocerca gregaria]
MAAGTPATPLLGAALLVAAAMVGQPGAGFPVELPANNRSLELGDCSWVEEGSRGHLGTVVSRCSVPNARLSTHVTLRTTQVVYAGEAPTCTISCVRALDQLAETAQLNVTLTGGGPGHTFVSLEVRAPVGYGYFFTVDAYLNCTGGVVPALRQTYLPAPSDFDATGAGASAPSCWPCAGGSWY